MDQTLMVKFKDGEITRRLVFTADFFSTTNGNRFVLFVEEYDQGKVVLARIIYEFDNSQV